jgi:hypothetical protein
MLQAALGADQQAADDPCVPVTHFPDSSIGSFPEEDEAICDR